MIKKLINESFIFLKNIFGKSEVINMCKAIDIANTFIEIGKDKPIPVSNMKLQKLLYYAQGWHLALAGKPLFEEALYKWNFGPVCPPVYVEFKGYGGEYIFEPSCSGQMLKDGIREFLELIWQMYGKHSAIQLSKLSHCESPWITTDMSEIIPIEKIKQCFCQKKQELEEKQVVLQ